MKKTHGYLTIFNDVLFVLTKGLPAADHAAGGTGVFDEDGEEGVCVSSAVAAPLMGGSIPEAPADKYPHGRTYIVRLEEVGK